MDRLFEPLHFLRGTPAIVLLVVISLLVFIFSNRKVLVGLFAASLLPTFALFLAVEPAELVLIKVITASFALVSFVLLGVRLGRDTPLSPAPTTPSKERAANFRAMLSQAPFFVRALLGIGIAAILWALDAALGGSLIVVPAVSLAVFVLMVFGVLIAVSAEEPLKAAIGLLFFLTGLSLQYDALNPTLLPLLFIATLYLGVTLMASYLSQTSAK